MLNRFTTGTVAMSIPIHVCYRLVDLYPEWVISWFAVGCYYYMAGKQDPARRYEIRHSSAWIRILSQLQP